MDFKILPFELKSASDSGSEFSGYANCFNNIDASQEIVAPGAFTDTLADFMANGFIGGLNHNWDSPIGKPVSAKEDPKGLFVEGKISSTEHGKDCMVLLKDRVIQKMSIGYRVQGDMMLDDAEAVAAYWKEHDYTPSAADIAAAQYGCRVLTKVHLYEFSPVTVPANTLADITRVKRYNADQSISYSQMEKCVRDVGLSQKAAKIFVSTFKALHQRDVEEADNEAIAETPPPQEPDTPTPSDIPPEPETQENEKQEPPTEVAPVVVADAVPVVEKADSREVAALYANFLTRQARLHA